MNSCCFTGRLTKDVEIRVVGEKQTNVAYYTIAAQDNYGKTDFINCQTYGKPADYLEKHGKKGIWIEFEGKTSTYTKDNQHNSVAVSTSVKLIFANSKKSESETDDDTNQDNTDQNEEQPF